MTILILIISLLILAILIYSTFLARNTNIKEELKEIINKNEENTEKIRNYISQEISQNRKEFTENSRELRQELIKTLTELNKTNSEMQKAQLDSFSLNLKNMSDTQIKQLENLYKSLNELTKSTQETLKTEIRFLQDKNEKKLEEIRNTVDEKLQSTLEKRLTESFKTVGERLESVYKGLGEMKTLASDVGDLKRVLTNVKQRGTFGELQLKNILEDILTKEQYIEKAKIKPGTQEQVEFAIKIPSKDEDNKYILLPVDSKFPREDYERILDAQQKSDPQALELAIKSLIRTINNEAKDIKEKYINPPATTDFAIMFLPVESLFAEVLRIPGLFEKIRKEHSIVITGPTTITAILNSLQMGFRTLAIEKRSFEVWKVLGAVKTEFEKFGKDLINVKMRLQQAAEQIEKTEKKTIMIGRKLKGVEKIEDSESEKLLEIETENPIEENSTEEK